jgi:hypothetical protein
LAKSWITKSADDPSKRQHESHANLSRSIKGAEGLSMRIPAMPTRCSQASAHALGHELRERLALTRFPDQAPGPAWAYGLGFLRTVESFLS